MIIRKTNIFRQILAGLSLLALCISVASAQIRAVFPGLSIISESDARESAISFVDMTTSPGMEGATIRVDNDLRQSEQWRSSLGFVTEFTLKNTILNGYWGMSIVGGKLNDVLTLIADDGRTVNLDLTREVEALRGSIGLSFPIDQNFKLRPFLSLVASRLRSESVIKGLLEINDSARDGRYNSKTQLISTVGSLDALYTRWYGYNKLELSAQYNYIFTEAYSEDSPLLDSDARNDTLQIKSKFGMPTQFSLLGKPWRWHSYANFTKFLSYNELSLGYTQLLEIGVGLDWQINIKPLDWFGWQSLGITVGFIAGDDVKGANIGLIAE